MNTAAVQAYANKPPNASRASVGGLEKQVQVAIAALPKLFCIPEPLVVSGLYYAK